MSKQKIAFVSPIGNGGPTELYKQLIPLLNEAYGDILECTLINSTSGWLRLHTNPEKYDTIVSVLPFLWKPPHCQFILNIHGDYRMDRGFKNPGSLLAFLYPYTSRFADRIIYPSKYLQEVLSLDHPHQEVIGNICPFPIQAVPKSYTEGKKEFHIMTTTNWNNLHKAGAILELAEVLTTGKDFNGKKILWSIIGGGNELYELPIQEIMRKNPNITVRLLGHKQKQEILSLLQESDIFLYATHAESFGIVILEAASQGLPLILIDYPAFHGLWNESSIISLNSINEELIKLMDDAIYFQKRSLESLENTKGFNPHIIKKQWGEYLYGQNMIIHHNEGVNTY